MALIKIVSTKSLAEALIERETRTLVWDDLDLPQVYFVSGRLITDDEIDLGQV